MPYRSGGLVAGGLALAFVILAVLGRWKSWRAFSGSGKKLANRVITLGEEE